MSTTALTIPAFEEDYDIEVFSEPISDTAMEQVRDMASGLVQRNLLPVLKKARGDASIKVITGNSKDAMKLPMFGNGQTDGTFIDVVVIEFRSSRSLWEPTDDSNSSKEVNPPVCKTSYLNLSAMEGAHGTWRKESPFQAPETMDEKGHVNCRTCPYNKFGSMRDWSGKDSNAKACGHGILYMVIPVQRRGVKQVLKNGMETFTSEVTSGLTFGGEPAHYYDFDPRLVNEISNPYGLLRWHASMSSDKEAIDGIASSLVTYKRPPQQIVFRLKPVMGGAGAVQFTKMTAKPIGIIGSRSRIAFLESIRDYCGDWIEKNMEFMDDEDAETVITDF